MIKGQAPCEPCDTGPILKLVTLRENRVPANNKNFMSSKVIKLFSVSAGGR